MNEQILKDLKPYMLYTDVMQNITSIENVYKKLDKNRLNHPARDHARDQARDRVSHQVKEYEKDKLSNFKEKVEDKKNRLWIPEEKDQLFWCFFYILYGDLKYEQCHKNNFYHESSMKIDAIEKLRQKKDLLKQHNIKLKSIEDEFSTNDLTSLKGLYSLCLLHNIRILYIKEYTYLDIGINDKIDGIIYFKENKNKIFLNNDNSCDYDENKINEIIKDKWKIINPDKPIKAATAYSLSELQEISKCLKIDLNENNSKKKTKNVLYQEILYRL